MNDQKIKDSFSPWIGMIPDNWVMSKIKFCCDVIMGQSPSSNDVNNESGKYLFMQGNAEFTKRYPAPVQYCENPNKVSRIGDVLMSVRAPVGEINISNQEFGIGRGLCSIKPLTINDNFLWYFLIKSKNDFSFFTNGSTFEAITTANLLNFPIVVPPIKEQIAISKFLDKNCSKIDSIIDDLEQQIEILEKYKKSVITVAVTKGLNPDAKMNHIGNNCIEKIPKNWDLSKVKYLYSIIGGNGFPDELQGNDNGEIPFCKVSDINGKGVYVSDAKNYISRHIQKQYKFNLVPINSIIFAKIGEALKKNHRKLNSVPCCIDNNTQALAIKNNARVDFKFSYYLFSIINMEEFDNEGTVPSVNNTKLKNRLILLPPYEEQKIISNKLDKRCSEIDSIIEDKNTQIETIKKYKNSLIYEYVTGKKRVSQGDVNE